MAKCSQLTSLPFKGLTLALLTLILVYIAELTCDQNLCTRYADCQLYSFVCCAKTGRPRKIAFKIDQTENGPCSERLREVCIADRVCNLIFKLGWKTKRRRKWNREHNKYKPHLLVQLQVFGIYLPMHWQNVFIIQHILTGVELHAKLTRSSYWEKFMHGLIFIDRS